MTLPSNAFLLAITVCPVCGKGPGEVCKEGGNTTEGKLYKVIHAERFESFFELKSHFPNAKWLWLGADGSSWVAVQPTSLIDHGLNLYSASDRARTYEGKKVTR